MVCPKCQYHFKMSPTGYFNLLFDGEYELFDTNIISSDPLKFVDQKAYKDRLEATRKKTGLQDAAKAAVGKVGGHELSIGAMDFTFIGGSMGSVVGEIIARSIKRAYEIKIPALVIAQSGGARMMEGALSLMQMAKTSAKLSMLSKAGLPFISILTDPTTGGVTASFAMLGDLNIAEPNALIAFAGPRVVKETIGKDLPEGFQRSEFLLEHGFLDAIVPRKELKSKLHFAIRMLHTSN